MLQPNIPKQPCPARPQGQAVLLPNHKQSGRQTVLSLSACYWAAGFKRSEMQLSCVLKCSVSDICAAVGESSSLQLPSCCFKTQCHLCNYDRQWNISPSTHARGGTVYKIYGSVRVTVFSSLQYMELFLTPQKYPISALNIYPIIHHLKFKINQLCLI